MTRETKIGLLVGLAFIIVIAILLSDQVTTSHEPPTAPLASAGSTVRQGVTTIGQPNVPVVVIAPEHVEPSAPIVTRQELAEPQPVELASVANQTTVPGDAPVGFVDPHAVSQAGITQTRLPAVAVAEPLVRLAIDNRNELEIVGAPSVSQPRQATQDQPSVPVAARTYVAEPGDSLGKMASKLLGTNNKANRDAIIRSNPALAKDPNRIIVGRTYIIPMGTLPPALTPAPQVLARARTAAPITTSTTVSRKTSGTFEWYTVKENDSLWKIASSQLGTGNAYQQIKDMNKDVLKGSDSVRPNMRLRIPMKPVASAS